MAGVVQLIENIWKIDSLSEFNNTFHPNFTFIDCDTKTYGKKEFLHRYILYHYEKPEIRDTSDVSIITEPSGEKDDLEAETGSFRFFDIELNNGRRIGFRTRWEGNFFSGSYSIEEAIVYNCWPDKLILEKFINYKPVFKAQKFMFQVWDHITSNRTEIAKDYFKKDFLFVGCPRSHITEECNMCGYIKFIELVETFSTRPDVYDAIIVEEEEKWQFAVNWSNRRMLFQFEDVDYRLVLTKGKEIDCVLE